MNAVLGVPGRWADRDALVAALVEQAKLVCAGPMLIDPREEEHVLVDVRPHDAQLRRAFELAGGELFDEEALAAIDAHTLVAYLVGEGGFSGAQRLLKFGRALLDAGGLAVKVESSGLAHPPAQWRRLALAASTPLALYEAFVVLVSSDLSSWSCGMHHFELPDAVVAGPRLEVNALLTRFLRFVVAETPDLESGHTFSVDMDAPIYRLSHEPCTLYPTDDLLHNPHGRWRLTRL